MGTSQMNDSATVTRRVLVYGAGGHAKVVADVLRRNGFLIVGFIDDVSPQRDGEPFCGSTVFGGPDQATVAFAAGTNLAFIAFGANNARLNKARDVMRIGFQFPTAVHPRAFVSHDALLGDGTVVCPNASVGPATSVGRHVIVNTGASIDHDCSVGDGVHVGPGAVIAGYANLGEASFVGAGAVVIDRIRVGRACTIGAGAVVTRDVPDGQTVVGVPAKPIAVH